MERLASSRWHEGAYRATQAKLDTILTWIAAAHGLCYSELSFHRTNRPQSGTRFRGGAGMSSTKRECPERSPGAMGGEGPVFGFRNVPRDCQPGFTCALCRRPQARSGRGPHPSRDAISAILAIAGGVQPTLGLAVWLLRAPPIPARVPLIEYGSSAGASGAPALTKRVAFLMPERSHHRSVRGRMPVLFWIMLLLVWRRSEHRTPPRRSLHSQGRRERKAP